MFARLLLALSSGCALAAVGRHGCVAHWFSLRDGCRAVQVQQVTRDWLDATDWEMVGVSDDSDIVKIRVTGPGASPSTDRLATLLTDAGVDIADVRVELIPSRVVDLEP